MKNSKIALLALALLVSCSNQTPEFTESTESPESEFSLADYTSVPDVIWEKGAEEITGNISSQALFDSVPIAFTRCDKYLPDLYKKPQTFNGFTYTVDGAGKPIMAKGRIVVGQIANPKRDEACQTQINKWADAELKAYKSFYDKNGLTNLAVKQRTAGHIIAKSLGGVSGRINMATQRKNMNLWQSQFETILSQCMRQNREGSIVNYQVSLAHHLPPSPSDLQFVPLSYNLRVEFIGHHKVFDHPTHDHKPDIMLAQTAILGVGAVAIASTGGVASLALPFVLAGAGFYFTYKLVHTITDKKKQGEKDTAVVELYLPNVELNMPQGVEHKKYAKAQLSALQQHVNKFCIK